jgi:5S rRNA maturation endonuclease (ribonuclease M5)
MTPELLKAHLEAHIEELFEALGVDIEEFAISEHEIRGKAPCHDGDNPTAFTYHYMSGKWACWTQKCHEEHGNDIIGLIRAIKNCSFSKAMKIAGAVLKGKHLKKIDQSKVAEWMRHKNYWEQHLSQDVFDPKMLERLNPASPYAEKRSLCPDIFSVIGAGYASKGKLKGRIVIPVRNIKGHIVGFTGRRLYDTKEWSDFPKWYHMVSKNINLFNIDRAHEAITNSGIAILCEGPFDVIKLEMAGFPQSAAALGTGVSRGHADILLQLHAHDIILIADNDKAGIKAAKKNADILKRYLFNVSIVTPPFDGADIGDMKIEDIQTLLEGII